MQKLMSSLALAVSLVATGALASSTGAEVGKAAPSFELKDESGKVHRLSDYKGKVVVLEWTNPECPFVKRHYVAKTMDTTNKSFAGKDVVWLAIDSTSHNTPQKSAAWKKEEGFSYPVLQDASGATGKAYGAKTTPHMFVIDGEGIVRYAGGIDDDPRGKVQKPNNHVQAAVTAVLAKKTPPAQSTKPYGCSVKYKAD